MVRLAAETRADGSDGELTLDFPRFHGYLAPRVERAVLRPPNE